ANSSGSSRYHPSLSAARLPRAPHSAPWGPNRAAANGSHVPSTGCPLDAPPLARAATVVRDRRYVTDRRDREAGRLQRTQRRFAAGAGARDFDFERAHAVLLRLLGGVLGGDLRRVRSRLARALETHGASRRPGNGVALNIGDGDHSVVERGVDVRHPRRDVFAFASADARGIFTHSEPFRGTAPAAPAPSLSFVRRYFFLPAMAFAGPLRVRALVWVR